ncbi:hypothetical protein [Novosphingobium sp. MMS21-SN21R]|uniref:hypothetical protein n=1 Tax=Novosphingobium sp. MMS21-SN21R TaxID=2969298 RepID=UPI0028843AF2|nr:hypothetical protein [Novosphingobium sp. MMS21-SN21R]MDT0510043.1 hypothetical protein [Novosphingobium sp. MMS21-SN21R]
MRIGKTALLSLAGGALFFAGYWIGMGNVPQLTESSALNSNLAEDLDGAERQVEDAIRRWSSKAAMSEGDVRRNWSPRAMFIPTRNQGQGMLCIQLQLQPGNLGGSPVYCYQAGFFESEEATKLVAEYSDVE